MNRKSDHKGLVQREITVKRGGKTFKQKRWVKAGEDEPAEKKGKKEDVKGSYTVGEKTLESYTVGDEFSFMGEAVIIEKVNNKEKTIKLSDGKVYTLNSIKKFSKPLAESKYKIGDKLIFNGKEKIVKRINRAQEVIEFDDGKLHTFDDIKTFSQEKPKKEIKIKDLKPIKKDPKIKKETKIKTISNKQEKAKKLPKNKSILLQDLVKSEKEAKKFMEDHGWMWDKESNIFPDVGYYNNLHSPTHIYTNDEGEIYGMAQYSEHKYKDQLNGRIKLLEINTPMRGKGYGRKMMKDVIKDMSKCDNITLDSLDDDSDKFYKAIGMKIDIVAGERDIVEPEGHFVGNKNWINEMINVEIKKGLELPNNDDDIKYDPMAKKPKTKRIIKIKKSETIKIPKFNEDGFVFKMKNFEDDSVKVVNDWFKIQQNELMKEIEKFYGDNI